MAGKSDVYEFALGKLVFNGSALQSTYWAATAGTTQLWVGLHTADPTDTASTAAEGGYTAYTRVPTDRSTVGTSPFGWSVSSGTGAALMSAAPTGNLDFPQVATTTTGTFSFFAVYSSSAATSTQSFYVGSISPVINFSQGVTPRLTTSSSITED